MVRLLYVTASVLVLLLSGKVCCFSYCRMQSDFSKKEKAQTTALKHL